MDIVQFTFAGIIMFWVLTHADEFGTVIASLTAAVQSGTRTMWGFR